MFNPRRFKVGLELTSKCNLRCGMCPLPVLRRPYEDMPWPLVEKAEREIHGLGLKLKWLHEMGEPLLYARIDMVPDADGRWWLMEAELIEPDFYLGADPRQGAAFAEAVARELGAMAIRGA